MLFVAPAASWRRDTRGGARGVTNVLMRGGECLDGLWPAGFVASGQQAPLLGQLRYRERNVCAYTIDRTFLICRASFRWAVRFEVQRD